MPTFEHGAGVLADGELLIALVTDRGGFGFRVAAGNWGWAKRPV